MAAKNETVPISAAQWKYNDHREISIANRLSMSFRQGLLALHPEAKSASPARGEIGHPSQWRNVDSHVHEASGPALT
jgi:hypothetical protein